MDRSQSVPRSHRVSGYPSCSRQRTCGAELILQRDGPDHSGVRTSTSGHAYTAQRFLQQCNQEKLAPPITQPSHRLLPEMNDDYDGAHCELCFKFSQVLKNVSCFQEDIIRERDGLKKNVEQLVGKLDLQERSASELKKTLRSFENITTERNQLQQELKHEVQLNTVLEQKHNVCQEKLRANEERVLLQDKELEDGQQELGRCKEELEDYKRKLQVANDDLLHLRLKTGILMTSTEDESRSFAEGMYEGSDGNKGTATMLEALSSDTRKKFKEEILDLQYHYIKRQIAQKRYTKAEELAKDILHELSKEDPKSEFYKRYFMQTVYILQEQGSDEKLQEAHRMLLSVWQPDGPFDIWQLEIGQTISQVAKNLKKYEFAIGYQTTVWAARKAQSKETDLDTVKAGLDVALILQSDAKSRPEGKQRLGIEEKRKCVLSGMWELWSSDLPPDVAKLLFTAGYDVAMYHFGCEEWDEAKSTFESVYKRFLSCASSMIPGQISKAHILNKLVSSYSKCNSEADKKAKLRFFKDLYAEKRRSDRSGKVKESTLECGYKLSNLIFGKRPPNGAEGMSSELWSEWIEAAEIMREVFTPCEQKAQRDTPEFRSKAYLYGRLLLDLAEAPECKEIPLNTRKDLYQRAEQAFKVVWENHTKLNTTVIEAGRKLLTCIVSQQKYSREEAYGICNTIWESKKKDTTKSHKYLDLGCSFGQSLRELSITNHRTDQLAASILEDVWAVKQELGEQAVQNANQEPEDRDLRCAHLRGVCLMRLGEYDDASSVLKVVWDSSGHSEKRSEYALSYAMCLSELAEFEKASEVLNQANLNEDQGVEVVRKTMELKSARENEKLEEAQDQAVEKYKSSRNTKGVRKKW
jgi:hypothetical protein